MSIKKVINIVWFKRDLRVNDNQALFEALKDKNVLPLYIIEPKLWNLPDMSSRQYLFLQECLIDLDRQLKKYNGNLMIKVGEVTDILAQITLITDIKSIYVHQETWNWWTYQRDIAVEKFCQEKNIFLKLFRQNGVIRKLKSRDGWSAKWHQFMLLPRFDPKKLCDNFVAEQIIENDKIPTYSALGLIDDKCIYRQLGGRIKGIKILISFLNQRSINYHKNLSSPLTAFEGCSRLSPYIAFGCISLREIYQLSQKKIAEIKLNPAQYPSTLLWSLKSFIQRLAWHCHFIQKLEDYPQLEFKNIHSNYDTLVREDDKILYKAWQEGKTGYPMIDACMRALIAHGWINFRMRAMLVSFASYHLWLDWKKTSVYLARMFVDYEPGIHYSQIQMQSGTTGINSIRIYNPIKQGIDHDPDGIFIKKWIPELKDVSKEFIHFPAKSVDPNIYPPPIVNESKAREKAKKMILAVIKTENFKEISNNITIKHGSRKSGLKQIVRKRKKKTNQLSLFK